MPILAADSAGGGRKVIRCEVSLDGGETWRLGDIERHEKPTPYNKYWCWVFWSVAVPGAQAMCIMYTTLYLHGSPFLQPLHCSCVYCQAMYQPLTCGVSTRPGQVLVQYLANGAIGSTTGLTRRLVLAAVDLLRSTEIRVRAVDSSNNMMPEKLTWNLMGARSAPALVRGPFPFHLRGMFRAWHVVTRPHWPSIPKGGHS